MWHVASVVWRLLSEIISRPLIGRKYDCYIVIEVIDLDELNEGNISAAAENNTNNGRLSWAVPHSHLKDTDNFTATDTMNIEPNIEHNIKPNIKLNINVEP